MAMKKNGDCKWERERVSEWERENEGERESAQNEAWPTGTTGRTCQANLLSFKSPKEWTENGECTLLAERERERVCVVWVSECVRVIERERERVEILAFWSWNGLAQVRGELLSRLCSLWDDRDDDENLIQPNIPCSRNGPKFKRCCRRPTSLFLLSLLSPSPVATFVSLSFYL